MLAWVPNGQDKYVLPELKVPVATPIAHKQGMSFAKPVEATIREAFKGADVVHFYMPFLPLAVKGKKNCRRNGNTHHRRFSCTAGKYHL